MTGSACRQVEGLWTMLPTATGSFRQEGSQHHGQVQLMAMSADAGHFTRQLSSKRDSSVPSRCEASQAPETDSGCGDCGCSPAPVTLNVSAFPTG